MNPDNSRTPYAWAGRPCPAGGLRRHIAWRLKPRLGNAKSACADSKIGGAGRVTWSGRAWAAEPCRDLLDNRVRGIHFYRLNRSTATREVYASLGLNDFGGLDL